MIRVSKRFPKCTCCGKLAGELHKDSCDVYKNLEVLDGESTITSPTHYTQGSLQPYDVIDDWELDYYAGSAVKYICRAGHKEDEVQDLKKAVEFLGRRIANLEKENA